MIRRAGYRTDREGIVRLTLRELWPYAQRAFPGRRFSRKEVLQRLRIREVFVKVGKNGDIIGFVMVSVVRGTLFIDLLAVDRAFHRCGIGSSLLSVVERYGRRKGASYAYLYVDETNVKAIRFYEKRGYLRTGYVETIKCFLYEKPL